MNGPMARVPKVWQPARASLDSGQQERYEPQIEGERVGVISRTFLPVFARHNPPASEPDKGATCATRDFLNFLRAPPMSLI